MFGLGPLTTHIIWAERREEFAMLVGTIRRVELKARVLCRGKNWGYIGRMRKKAETTTRYRVI